MYLGSWKIDDYLTFTCNTHTPSTGAATDADSVPTYRVYEDETGTPITNGSTAKLDDAGTTGFYSERVQLLTATGFEKGKTYTVYISATVGAVIGTMSHTFQIEAEVDANTVTGSVPSVAGAVGSVTGSVGSVVGHTAQTGDGYAIVNNGTYGNSAIETLVDELESRLTAARAGYLDNLSAGAVALASALATAQTDLDTITGSDGVTLATAQALYAPNKVVPDAAGTAAGLHTTTDGKVDVVDANVDAILADTGTDGVLLAATATSAQLVDDMWDEVLTGALHNIVNSAGRRVREIGAYAIDAGTAQAGALYSITLAATASATDGIYNRNLVVLTDNTGVGQTRTIVDYNGTSKVAVIDRDWRVTPDATTVYQVTADNTPLVVDQGVAQDGTATTIKLRAYASSSNDIYLCNVVAIIAGTGRGQARLIGSYNGTTKVATICGDNWITTPDATSVYVLMPYGTTCTSCIGTYARGQINTECDTALTDYDPPTRTEATADKDAIITEVNANETKIDTIDTVVDAILVDTGTTLPATLTTMEGKIDTVDTVADAILVDTGTTIPGTITTLQTDSTAIKAKTDDLPSGFTKNVAVSAFNFLMVLSSDHVTPATGKTVTGTISKDGAAFGALTNAISEIASGMYKVDITQAEMNADVVTLKFTETDCDQRVITLYTS